MKKIMSWLLVLSLSVAAILVFSLAGCAEGAAEEAAEEATEATEEATEETEEATEEPVVITYTSWRTEDKERVDKINAIFTEEHPNIVVEFNPLIMTEYEAQLLVSLEGGVGADICQVLAHDRGLPAYDAGYLMPLNDLLEEKAPEILELDSSGLSAWTADDGQIYAVPNSAVVHGIYYNKDIFDEYNLEEPETWDEYINILDTLKENGVTPIAAGSKDGLVVSNFALYGYGPNFFGGHENRMKLINGELKFTDEPFSSVFETMEQLVNYYPNNPTAIDYSTCQQMFVNGQAGVFMGGSWEVSTFETLGYDFELGWFPNPVVNKGDRLQFTFEPNGGLAINKDTEHVDEILEYLSWYTTCDYGQALLDNLPGFLPYPKCDYEVDNELVLEFLDVIQDSNTDLDVRFVEQKISRGEPSVRTLMFEVGQKVVAGEMTAEEAAEYVQEGLDSWYVPE